MNRDDITKRHEAAKGTRIGITASLPADDAAWEFLTFAWSDIGYLLERLEKAEAHIYALEHRLRGGPASVTWRTRYEWSAVITAEHKE